MLVTPPVYCSGCFLLATAQELNTAGQAAWPAPSAPLQTAASIYFFHEIVQFELFWQFACLRGSFPANPLELLRWQSPVTIRREERNLCPAQKHLASEDVPDLMLPGKHKGSHSVTQRRKEMAESRTGQRSAVGLG